MNLAYIWAFVACTVAVEAFTSPQIFNGPNVATFSSSALHAASTKSSMSLAERRKRLLARSGPYFQLERSSGAIEFGATADLVTTLDPCEENGVIIRKWMSNERGLALSIWDENMLQELGNNVYRLETMNLQFVTIQLAPKIDVKMVTKFPKEDPTLPVFVLQSIGFNPNIKLLPGLTVSAKDLGIEIEVSGEMRPSKDQRGVTGRIAFQTSGILPPPMRILPEQVLKSATDAIDQTIVEFAIQSFQKGAREQYRNFKAQQQPQ